MSNSWRSLIARSLKLNRDLPYSRYVQLATVRPNGLPANRTVVFRGFRDETDGLKFITDGRSQKIEHLIYCSWSEVCWYFPKTREQFRLLGKIMVVDGYSEDLDLKQIRQSTWEELSDNARSQFNWADPGKPKTENWDAPPSDRLSPAANFCLLLLDPIEVDFLALKGEPQTRYRYILQENGWSMQEINP